MLETAKLKQLHNAYKNLDNEMDKRVTKWINDLFSGNKFLCNVIMADPTLWKSNADAENMLKFLELIDKDIKLDMRRYPCAPPGTYHILKAYYSQTINE